LEPDSDNVGSVPQQVKRQVKVFVLDSVTGCTVPVDDTYLSDDDDDDVSIFLTLGNGSSEDCGQM
jgi:hypothetical protein